MSGLEAINHYNGWSMAVLGTSIVFSGLVVLSLAISQLKKVINYWETRTGREEKQEGRAPSHSSQSRPAIPLPAVWPEDIREAAGLYKPLFDQLGSPFQLADLYRLSGDNNYPHPHLTIKLMREAQIIIPSGDGNFSVIL